MTWAPDEAYAITLDTRPDRFDVFRRSCGNLGFQVERFVASTPSSKPTGHRASREAWGNATSHRELLRRGEGTILILEDDAVIPPDFQDRMTSLLSAVPNDWEWLQLGGAITALPQQLEGDCRLLRGFARTHAYVCRGQGRRVAAICAATATGHWDDHAGVVFGRRGTAYAPRELFIDVADVTSTLPDSAPLTRGLEGRLGSSSTPADPPLRLQQRNDGRGPTGHARLKPNTQDRARIHGPNHGDGEGKHPYN